VKEKVIVQTPPPVENKPATDSKPKATPKTLKLSDLMKVDNNAKASDKTEEKTIVLNEPFTPEQLQKVWNEFVETRRKYQAEYQMLSQPFELRNNTQIVVSLHSPVHETMLNGIRLELGTLLREKLRNTSIQLMGEFVKEGDQKKAIYTNTDKFEYLMGKNPALRELKERFGLDPEF
jgi:DNA polymerase-3 subunit gamma/tau